MLFTVLRNFHDWQHQRLEIWYGHNLNADSAFFALHMATTK